MRNKKLKTKNLPRKIPKEFIWGYKLKTQKGAAAILMSFFVLTIILLIASTAATIMFFEIKMSREIGNSIPAFYAADAGTEQCLYQIRNSDSGEPCDSTGGTINASLGNGASFIATRTAAETTQSIGTFSATNRKIQTDWLP